MPGLASSRVIPKLLHYVAKTRSRELFTLIVLVLVLALDLAVGSAQLFGASMALGAFLAGMVVSGGSEVALCEQPGTWGARHGEPPAPPPDSTHNYSPSRGRCRCFATQILRQLSAYPHASLRLRPRALSLAKNNFRVMGLIDHAHFDRAQSTAEFWLLLLRSSPARQRVHLVTPRAGSAAARGH